MEITIYFEGGGDSRDTKAALRQGMSAFLKPLVDLARQRRSLCLPIPCGSRGQAFDDFRNAVKTEPEKFNVLLVDSEAAVKLLPRAHLRQRDGWNLNDAKEDQVHLMAWCMETWLVADPEALAEYYGRKFNKKALPQRINLEEEPKTQIYAKLKLATRQTQKGPYHKIKHARDLLKCVGPEEVKKRCQHCARLFKVVEAKIQS